MSKSIFLLSLSVFAVYGCATSEDFDREVDSFLNHVVPKFIVDMKSGLNVGEHTYKQCMKSCLSTNSSKQCTKFADDAAEKCSHFLKN